MDEFIRSKEYDGYSRKLYKKNCKFCGSEFLAPRHEKIYCSRACFGKDSSTAVEVECDFCHQLHKRKPSHLYIAKTGLRFCSKECKDQAQCLGEKFNKALKPRSTGQAYRSHALRVYGAKCKICGYSEYKKMLDVDHIDSNRKNNAIENLQVLCVWCHALKTRKISWHERRSN